MQESHTSADTYNVSYKWNIHNFQDYLNLHDQKEDILLRSTHFLLPPGKKCKFWLQITILYVEDKDKDTISCYLNWADIVDDTKLKYTVCILNSNNDKYNVRHSCTSGRSEVLGVGWKPYIKKTELVSKSADLLPNNTLTLQCDLIVHEGTPKSYDTELYVLESSPSLINRLKNLLDNQMGSDFTFHVGNEQFKAHKLFLIDQSSVFQAMFENEMSEKINNYTIITDIKPEIFKIFLEYIYTNEIEVNMNCNDTIELLAAADKYQINLLKEKCFAHLSALIQCENVVDIFLVAKKYENSKLVELAKSFITLYCRGGDVIDCLFKRLCVDDDETSNSSKSEKNDEHKNQDKIVDK